jgi:uncharacterized protein (TIGR00375 family)
MKVIADFHIHGRFSQATSKALDIPNLEKWARIKGLGLLGTGDFTHPKWIEELKAALTDDGSGILRTESGFPFVLQTELSNIYSQDGRGRRVHNIILAPSFEAVDQITAELLKRGRVDYDGRPIFGIPCPDLVEMLKGVDKRVEIIPAHVWTPWFSLFGSKSGFDSLADCFQDQSRHIFALETGLSSDPAMNWRLSALDKYALVSNSDCHSFWPWRIGREANVFEMEKLTYDSFIGVMKERDPRKFLCTIEVDPSYGKYHLDGHRNCGVCMEPKESLKARKMCPKCGREMTIGVLNRVEELADRPEGHRPKGAIPFKSLIPLSEIIAAVSGGQPHGKKAWQVFNVLIGEFGSEFNVLLDAPRERIAELTGGKLADAIMQVREGRIQIKAGYDGVYGEPLFDGRPAAESAPSGPQFDNKQKSLSEFSGRSQ